MARYLIIALLLFVSSSIQAAEASDLEDQTRAVATELRCVVCQNLSVADSPSEMAQQMRAIVREQLQAGKTPQEVKDFFVSKYGEWVLLKPSTHGFALLVWVVPFVALLIGLGLGVFFIRRWAANKRAAPPPASDPALLTRARETLAGDEPQAVDLEDSSPRAQLSRERARLYADLKELEFDFQAGRLSEADCAELRRDIETKAVSLLGQLDRLPVETSRDKRAAKAQPAAQPTGSAAARPGIALWKLVAGGVFLLVFGLSLGLVLTNSLRPRGSQGDSITGGFLTGTRQSNGGDVAALLQQAKTAFNQQDMRAAIEGFKKVLAVDPNQPEANSFMGLILMQAGHADGALMAFDKVLSQAPNFPMALWGKGMALYQGKQDYAGARQVFEKLLPLLPSGPDHDAIVKLLADIPAAGTKPQTAAKPAAIASSPTASGQITGRITIDPKLKANVDPNAAIFIIARAAAGAGGPPLAVKKIDRPTFPLAYSLGAESMMMQGTPFSGKMIITVRLDKDGNPATRGAGDLSGDYKKNPVEAGSKNVDIVLDQLAK